MTHDMEQDTSLEFWRRHCPLKMSLELLKVVAGVPRKYASVDAGLLPGLDPASLEATRLPGGNPASSLLYDGRICTPCHPLSKTLWTGTDAQHHTECSEDILNMTRRHPDLTLVIGQETMQGPVICLSLGARQKAQARGKLASTWVKFFWTASWPPGEPSRDAAETAASPSEETRDETKADVCALEARERGCGLACSAAILRSALRMAASVNSSGADDSSRSCTLEAHERAASIVLHYCCPGRTHGPGCKYGFYDFTDAHSFKLDLLFSLWAAQVSHMSSKHDQQNRSK